MDIASLTPIKWEIMEFHKHERSHSWYLAWAVFLIFFLIYGLWTANYLLPIILLLAAWAFYWREKREPEVLLCEINGAGLKVGAVEYPWKKIINFWIVYNPPEVKSVFFHVKGLQPIIALPLMNVNPLELRERLRLFLPEDFEREGEPLSHFLGRKLKLH